MDVGHIGGGFAWYRAARFVCCQRLWYLGIVFQRWETFSRSRRENGGRLRAQERNERGVWRHWESRQVCDLRLEYLRRRRADSGQQLVGAQRGRGRRRPQIRKSRARYGRGAWGLEFWRAVCRPE